MLFCTSCYFVLNNKIVKFYKQLYFFFNLENFFLVFSILKYSYNILDDTVKIWEWRNQNTRSNEFFNSGSRVSATERASALLPPLIVYWFLCFMINMYVKIIFGAWIINEFFTKIINLKGHQKVVCFFIIFWIFVHH